MIAGPMAAERSAFDRVVISSATSGRQTYSAEEFLALPLATRIAHILAREVRFFQGPLELERAEALKSLRR
jgi:hypothetical protein